MGECLERLERYRQGVDLPEGFVPATFLVGDVGGQVVARVSVRHELNAWLDEVGGRLDSVAPGREGFPAKRRYWVDLV